MQDQLAQLAFKALLALLARKGLLARRVRVALKEL